MGKKPISVQNVEDMANYRSWIAENPYDPEGENYSKMRNENNRSIQYYPDDPVFNEQLNNMRNEQAYQDLLLSEYYRQRELQYYLIVQNETQKVYNLSEAGRSLGFTENQGVWNGYERCPSLQAQVSNCAVSRIPSIGHTINPSFTSGTACCAITSTAIQAQICGAMGYDGKDNIIQPKKWEPLALATEQCYHTKISEKYAHDGDNKPLNQLIKEGKIGIGDEVSICSSDSDSGGHAITIADIQYDSNGTPKSYTYHSNNNRHFATMDISSKSWPGGERVLNYLNTEKYWQDVRNNEYLQLACDISTGKISTEELEKKVQDTANRTKEIINDTRNTELYAAQHGYDNHITNSYKEELAQYENSYDIWTRRQNSPSATEVASIQNLFPLSSALSIDKILSSTEKRISTSTEILAQTSKEESPNNALMADAEFAKNAPKRKLDEYAQEPELRPVGKQKLKAASKAFTATADSTAIVKGVQKFVRKCKENSRA